MDQRLVKIREKLAALLAEVDAILAEQTANARDIFQEAINHIVAREGLRLVVYKDSLGIPTVGVGHVVRPEDNLKVGDAISAERANAFMAQDANTAFGAATSQLNELGLNNLDFLIALTAVNFQMGTQWFKKFPKTWALIKAKRYADAAVEVADSLWAKQTPVRVKDFQNALYKLHNQRRDGL